MTDSLSEDILESIRNEYKETLEFPQIIPGKQIFLCSVGLVGAGKTTVIKPLAKKLGLLRISGDEIRFILNNRGLSYSSAFEIGKRMIEKYAKQGYSIAHDTDCATPKTIEAITLLSKELAVDVIWVHINPPEEFIINKLTNYNHTWLFKNAEEAVCEYRSRKKFHENLPMNFIYTFDTSKENLNNQIKEAFSIIYESLK